MTNLNSLSNKIKICIFGTGALGTVFGGFLQKNGCDITYIGLGKHFNTIIKNGIKITGIWGDHHVNPIKTLNIDESNKSENTTFDIILLCVKSINTEEAAKQASKLLKKDSIIVSVQNGLNNVEKISKYAGEEKTIGGRIIFGVEISEPGIAKVSVYADKVLLGNPFLNESDLTSKRKEHLYFLSNHLTNSGIPTKCVDREEIVAKIWEKVLYNSALNPLGALFEVPYGKLGENPFTIEYMKNILKEIFQIVKKKKILLSFSKYQEYFDFLLSKQLPPTKEHHSSMLQDIKAGRMTEIESLNGAIVKFGIELGIKTPHNEMLTRFIKAKENFALKN